MSDLHTLWGGEQATSVRAERPNPPQLAHWIPIARQLTVYLGAMPEHARVCFVTDISALPASPRVSFHDCFRVEDLEQLGRDARMARAVLAERAAVQSRIEAK